MTGRKILVASAAAVGVVILSWVVLVGALYAWGGVMSVRVQDRQEGLNLYLPVPMALIDAATTTATLVDSGNSQLHFSVEMEALGDWGPFVQALLESLDEAPDVTLVEVDDDTTRVRVCKERGVLRVEVDEEDVSVRVSVPTRAVHRNLKRLARLI
jgi:hypothetical protein